VCAPGQVSRYAKRISGPLLDRIDLHVEAPRVDYDKLAGRGEAENSATVRARVQAARDRQRARFAGTKLACNADMGRVSPKLVRFLVVAMSESGFPRVVLGRPTVLDESLFLQLDSGQTLGSRRLRGRATRW